MSQDGTDNQAAPPGVWLAGQCVYTLQPLSLPSVGLFIASRLLPAHSPSQTRQHPERKQEAAAHTRWCQPSYASPNIAITASTTTATRLGLTQQGNSCSGVHACNGQGSLYFLYRVKYVQPAAQPLCPLTQGCKYRCFPVICCTAAHGLSGCAFCVDILTNIMPTPCTAQHSAARHSRVQHGVGHPRSKHSCILLLPSNIFSASSTIALVLHHD